MDFENLVLRPNCLITRSDLVFIPGPRSLFFYENPFGLLPRYLYEHGYVVHVLSLPFRGSGFRRRVLKKWLESHASQKYHFILDEITFDELGSDLPKQQTQSITLIKAEKEREQSLSSPQDMSSENSHSPFIVDVLLETARWRKVPLSYRLHQIFNQLLGQSTPPYEVTYSKYNSMAFDRFLDHCVKLAENESYA